MEARAKLALSSNHAVAYAVKSLDVDVIAAYPITPQTHVVEKLSEFIANGELDAEMIHAESEHSALSSLIGAAATGARTFTATASQGLALMHELLHIASGLRLPIVMSVATRALSAPISIWNDHSDLMNSRDTGWIILFASTAQEVYDTIIQAYRIAEDPEVNLPVMVAYDGYLMSHTVEPVEIASDESVIKFSPKRARRFRLDPDRPVTIGGVATPEWYYEFKYQQVVAMRKALGVTEQVDEEFMKAFGRGYGLVEGFMVDDAEVALVVMGALTSTAQVAAVKAREMGVKAGVVRLRLYRPLPAEALRKTLGNVECVGVVDRAISYGAPYEGPVFNEVYPVLSDDKQLVSFIAGIGQRHVLIDDMIKMFLKLERVARGEEVPPSSIYVGVKGLEH